MRSLTFGFSAFLCLGLVAEPAVGSCVRPCLPTASRDAGSAFLRLGEATLLQVAGRSRDLDVGRADPLLPGEWQIAQADTGIALSLDPPRLPTVAWPRGETVLLLIALCLASILSLLLLMQAFRLHRTKRLLRLGERTVNFAAASAGLGLWRWNSTTRNLWASDSCRKMMSLDDPADRTVAGLFRMVHPEDRAGLDQIVREAIDAGVSFDTEFRVIDQAGELRWMRGLGHPATADAMGPAGMIGLIADITDRRRAEIDLAEHRTMLLHLMRLNLLGELSGALAHELKQPLTAIMSNAQAAQRILQRQPFDLAEMQAILDDIVTDDRRASEIIRRLRSLLRKGPADRQAIDLNELLDETLSLANSGLLEHRVRTVVRTAPDLPFVLGDRIQIQQVLLNLIMNGCEAMDAVTAERRMLILHTSQIGGLTVRMSISDRGPGIAEELKNRLFEPFFTTKANGLGLGLPICRSIISAHGGKLWMENDHEGGAVFHIALPAQEAAEVRAA